MSKVAPCLWFESEAEKAASFYVSLLPNSRMTMRRGARLIGRREMPEPFYWSNSRWLVSAFGRSTGNALRVLARRLVPCGLQGPSRNRPAVGRPICRGQG
jgi:3-demethylubiquinone-9 3-methyltransferase